MTMREVPLRAGGERESLLSLWLHHQLSSWMVVAFSVLLFAAILSLRTWAGDASDAPLVLFVIPVAICAMEFGLRGGLLAATGAFVVLVLYETLGAHDVGLLGMATRGTAYLVVGGLLGRFVDERRALEAKVERHFDLALDMFGTATFDGYFEELNPVWERVLGHSTEELCSRPFIDFVHPEDRERTEAEAAKLAEVGIDTVNFRNRYRTAEGEYRWLEWSVHPDQDERRLYATARDITIQEEAERALQNQTDQLERMVRERTRELEESRLETLQRLAIAAEYRDDDTQQHTQRVGDTAALIARQLGLPAEEVELIRQAAPLHDIGKVGISDTILLKPGPLTAEEFRAMQGHVEIGAKILADGKFPVLRMARVIALSHHERWDGTGYPNGLAGDGIPLVGRITAIADVFDALTHDRPYKPAWTLSAAVAEIGRCSGGQFDPDVVTAFLRLSQRRMFESVEDPGNRSLGRSRGRGRSAAPAASRMTTNRHRSRQ